MKIKTVGRHIREGAKNLGRNGWMTFASVSAVMVTLLLLGSFLTLALNINAFSKDIEGQIEMNVIVQDKTSRTEIDTLGNQLKSLSGIKSVQFVSKEEGLRDLGDKLKDYRDLLVGLDIQNPLPDKYIVKAVNPRDTDRLAEQIRTFPAVEKVKDGRETADKLFKVFDYVRLIGAIFVIGLLFTAMFLIANTIKITIFARRREIEIMKLVGATNWFIRWPFFVEGVFMGSIGALIPIGLIGTGYYYLTEAFVGIPQFSVLPFSTVIPEVGAVLLLIGALIGMFGSIVSVSKFLRV